MNAFWKFCFCQLLGCSVLAAEPIVVSGTAHIAHPSANHQKVSSSDKAILHWDKLSIEQGHTLEFALPDKQSAVFNRVTGKEASRLLGNLVSNGQVYLVNPNGIFIGEKAIIRTASFLASTLDFNMESFSKDSDLTLSGKSKASITNMGVVEAWDGDIVFASYGINNEGSLKAPNGTVSLAAAERLVLRPAGSRLIFVQSKEMAEGAEKDKKGGIKNSGRIEALKAELMADGNVYALAITSPGLIDATGVEKKGGRILLKAKGGRTEVDGTLKAQSGPGLGGKIEVLGEEVIVNGEALIDASGEKGGGQIFIGGSFQGKDSSVLSSDWTYVGPNVRLLAHAITEGNGGQAIVWSDKATQFYGSAFAGGGTLLGNGGLVEVSGSYLDYQPAQATQLLAPNGKSGMLLLDPANLYIVADSTPQNNVTTSSPFRPSTDAPVAAHLHASVVQTALESGDVTILTKSGYGTTGNGDIHLLSNISVPTKDHKITVNAEGTFYVTALLEVGGGSGASDGGAIDVVCGALDVNPTTAPAGLVAGKSIGIAVISGGGAQIKGGSSANAYALIGGRTHAPSILMDVGGNMTLTGGTASDAHAVLGCLGTTPYDDQASGGFTISVGGNLTLKGGSHGNAFIEPSRSLSHVKSSLDITAHSINIGGSSQTYIGSNVLSGSATVPLNINLNCTGGDLTIEGSDVSGSSFFNTFVGYLVEGSGTQNVKGKVAVNMQGGSIHVTGNRNNNAFLGYSITKPTGLTANFGVDVDITRARDIVITGDASKTTSFFGSAVIGGLINTTSTAAITISDAIASVGATPHAPSIQANLDGQLVLTGGSIEQSYAGFGIMCDQNLTLGGTASLPNPLVKVTGTPTTIYLHSGSEPATSFSSAGAYIGVFTQMGNGKTVSYSSSRIFDVEIDAPTANVTLSGPHTTMTHDFAAIGGFSGSSDSGKEVFSSLTMNVGNVAMGSPQESQTQAGGTFIKNIVSSSDTSNRSSFECENLEIKAPNGGINLANTSKFHVKQSAVLSQKSRIDFDTSTVLIDGDLTMGGESAIATTDESRDHTILVGKSILVKDFATISAVKKNLTIVADNLFPTAPLYDFNSTFEFEDSAKVELTNPDAADEVKFYAVAPNRYAFTEVQRGGQVKKTPGASVKQVYYPGGTYKQPFSVFFKVHKAKPHPPVDPTVHALNASLEEFDSLRHYFDEFEHKVFGLRYLKGHAGSWGGKDTLSTFDLFEESDYIE